MMCMNDSDRDDHKSCNGHERCHRMSRCGRARLREPKPGGLPGDEICTEGRGRVGAGALKPLRIRSRQFRRRAGRSASQPPGDQRRSAWAEGDQIVTLDARKIAFALSVIARILHPALVSPYTCAIPRTRGYIKAASIFIRAHGRIEYEARDLDPGAEILRAAAALLPYRVGDLDVLAADLIRPALDLGGTLYDPEQGEGARNIALADRDPIVAQDEDVLVAEACQHPRTLVGVQGDALEIVVSTRPANCSP